MWCDDVTDWLAENLSKVDDINFASNVSISTLKQIHYHIFKSSYIWILQPLF